MAIQTGGFRVSVMPTYTPVDPTMAVFDPSTVTRGISQAMAIRQQADALKEAQATQALRIAATNASNKKITDLFPAQTEEALSGSALSTAKNRAALANVMPEAQAAGLEAQARSATSANVVANSKQAGSTGLAQLKAQQKQYEDQLAMSGDEMAARQAELKDAIAKLAEAPQDRETHRNLVKAQTALAEAEAGKNDAEAKYNEFVRGQGRPYQDFQMLGQQIANETANISKLYATKVGEDEYQRPITLGQWLEKNKVDEKGNMPQPGKRSFTHWFPDDVMVKAPSNVIDLLNQVNASSANVDKYRQLQNQLQFTPGVGSPQKPAPAQSGLSQGDIVSGYRFKGGNPKDKANWEKVK